MIYFNDYFRTNLISAAHSNNTLDIILLYNGQDRLMFPLRDYWGEDKSFIHSPDFQPFIQQYSVLLNNFHQLYLEKTFDGQRRIRNNNQTSNFLEFLGKLTTRSNSDSLDTLFTETKRNLEDIYVLITKNTHIAENDILEALINLHKGIDVCGSGSNNNVAAVKLTLQARVSAPAFIQNIKLNLIEHAALTFIKSSNEKRRIGNEIHDTSALINEVTDWGIDHIVDVNMLPISPASSLKFKSYLQDDFTPGKLIDEIFRQVNDDVVKFKQLARDFCVTHKTLDYELKQEFVEGLVNQLKKYSPYVEVSLKDFFDENTFDIRNDDDSFGLKISIVKSISRLFLHEKYQIPSEFVIDNEITVYWLNHYIWIEQDDTIQPLTKEIFHRFLNQSDKNPLLFSFLNTLMNTENNEFLDQDTCHSFLPYFSVLLAENHFDLIAELLETCEKERKINILNEYRDYKGVNIFWYFIAHNAFDCFLEIEDYISENDFFYNPSEGPYAGLTIMGLLLFKNESFILNNLVENLTTAQDESEYDDSEDEAIVEQKSESAATRANLSLIPAGSIALNSQCDYHRDLNFVTILFLEEQYELLRLIIHVGLVNTRTLANTIPSGSMAGFNSIALMAKQTISPQSIDPIEYLLPTMIELNLIDATLLLSNERGTEINAVWIAAEKNNLSFIEQLLKKGLLAGELLLWAPQEGAFAGKNSLHYLLESRFLNHKPDQILMQIIDNELLTEDAIPFLKTPGFRDFEDFLVLNDHHNTLEKLRQLKQVDRMHAILPSLSVVENSIFTSGEVLGKRDRRMSINHLLDDESVTKKHKRT